VVTREGMEDDGRGAAPDQRRCGQRAALGSTIAPEPEAYLLDGQTAPEPLTMVLRPRDSVVLSAERLRQLAQAVAPRVLIERIRPGTDDLSDRVVTPRRRTLLLSLLGCLGMLLTL
jgi:hypothetical protein